jgi:hypothetical protein
METKQEEIKTEAMGLQMNEFAQNLMIDFKNRNAFMGMCKYKGVVIEERDIMLSMLLEFKKMSRHLDSIDRTLISLNVGGIRVCTN